MKHRGIRYRLHRWAKARESEAAAKRKAAETTVGQAIEHGRMLAYREMAAHVDAGCPDDGDGIARAFGVLHKSDPLEVK